uniref:Uncharacterized protein n=1 Tax=Opuntia streptacantha TaxID=393608 RepID=A0A7C8YQM3_OPUST
MAATSELVLDSSTRPDTNPTRSGPESEISRTINPYMVLTRDPSTHFPLYPPIDLDVHLDNPGVLILEERESEVRCHRDVVAVQKGRPDRDVLVTLVRGGYPGCVRHLLVMVRRVHIQPLVVDSDSLVGVAGGQGDLERHC